MPKVHTIIHNETQKHKLVKIQSLKCADEIIIIANSKDKMQRLMNKNSEKAEEVVRVK